MLNITLLPAPSGHDGSQRRTIIEASFTLSGDYVEGGEPISWTKLAPGIPTPSPVDPLWVEAYMSTPSANGPIYIPVLYNAANSTLQVWVAQSGDELAAGAYSASYTGAQFLLKAEFPVG
jgi:hypothetical protein